MWFSFRWRRFCTLKTTVKDCRINNDATLLQKSVSTAKLELKMNEWIWTNLNTAIIDSTMRFDCNLISWQIEEDRENMIEWIERLFLRPVNERWLRAVIWMYQITNHFNNFWRQLWFNFSNAPMFIGYSFLDTVEFNHWILNKIFVVKLLFSVAFTVSKIILARATKQRESQHF